MIVRKYNTPEPTTATYEAIPGFVDIPVASFISSFNPSTVGNSVTFTDTSTDTPTTWNWSFDNRTTWSNGTVQNPSHTFSTIGAYNVTLVCNSTAGQSDPFDLTQLVVNASGFNQQDIWMTGQYLQTFQITDSTTNVPIPVVGIADTGGNSYSTTNGTGYLTEPAGLIYVTFIADGYQTKQVTYVVDQDETHEVKLVPSAPSSGGTSNWYSPHQVRFAVVDSMGAKVVGAGINASVIVSTFPQDGTADWLTEMYGINADVANDMLNGTLIMHGTTQSDGATVFTMHSSIGYSLAVTNPSNGVVQTVNVTPIDTIYTIHLLGSAANNTYMDMGYNTSLYVTEPDVHNVTMNLAYQDMSARTTLLEFFVLARSNNTVINYQSTSSIGSNVILMNFTVPNIKPDRYSWYYNAVRIK
jgi:PKD repeat protein